MTRRRIGRALSGPRDVLLEALLATGTKLASMGSIDASLRWGEGFGRLWVWLGLPRRARVRRQLEAAFSDASPETLDVWTREVFVHFGRSLAEILLLRGRHRDALLEGVEIEGLEVLQAAEKASPTGGVLLVSAHYGNWELAGLRLARLGIPLTVVVRKRSNAVLERALRMLRAGDDATGADYEQVEMGRAGLGLVRALRAGRTGLVLLDQNARREESEVVVPFFGRPASVRAGPIRLALRLGVPILPGFVRRHPNGAGHRIRIHPPLEPSSTEGAGNDADTRSILECLTHAIETEIRGDPGQWIWTHRRWRSVAPAAMTPVPADRPTP
jgi:KDO2-lipid IV(A) lauroyltransferase